MSFLSCIYYIITYKCVCVLNYYIIIIIVINVKIICAFNNIILIIKVT